MPGIGAFGAPANTNIPATRRDGIIVNAGALIRGAHFHLDGRREPVDAIGGRIGETLASVLETARDVARRRGELEKG